MKIQLRDKKLMALVYRYGVLTTAQLRKLCFPGVAHTTVLRRLRLLEEARLIHRMNGLEDGLLCWILTDSGAKQVGLDCFAEYRNRNILKHTVTLADLRLHFEKEGLAHDWVSEIELKRQAFDARRRSSDDRVIPDGIFTANVLGKPGVVAVELELNPKTRSRYSEIFRHYSYRKNITVTWYIVPSQALGESLLRLWQPVFKFPQSPKLMFSVLDDLLNDVGSAKIRSAENSFIISEIFQLKVPSECAHGDAQGQSGQNRESLSISAPTQTPVISTA